ncbi:MAG TPA: murein biosynthesis integral membrane protein MurJ [Candidatus Limnocylindrales bacterium]|nr:murein biosynthesis integral membrane protein MurJ [Candidatus Limnocylindrales bacterium]
MSQQRRRIVSAATLILGVFVLSRILGYARDLVIANTFGTSQHLDDYQVAFRVPDLLFNLLLAGAISSAFIPVLSEHLALGETHRAREIAERVLNSGILILTAGAVLLWLGAPLFVNLTAYGYGPADHDLIVKLTRILLLQPIFLGAGGLVVGILSAHQRFLGQSPAALVYNLSIITAAAVFAPRVGVEALAWGVVVGAVLFLAVQLPSLWRTGWRPHAALGWNDPGVRKVGRLMFPIALGLAAAQINLFVDTTLATSLPHGRVAALKYADTIAQVPLGTFSSALAYVLFPFLSRDAALNAIERLRDRLLLSLRLNIFMLVPSAFALAVFGLPIVAILFQRGHFDQSSTRETAVALVFFSLGLVSQAATALLVRGFYALQDVITPLKISALVIAVNLMTNVFLVRLLAQGGLALGTSIAATLNAILLGRLLLPRLGSPRLNAVALSFTRAVIGSLPMVLTAGGVYLLIAGFTFGGSLRHVAAGAAAIVVGAATYLLVERALGSAELPVLLSVIRRR